MIDNMIVIVVLNYMGISYLDFCNCLGKEIWEWCIDCNIWFSVVYIFGVYNIKVDFELR